jgi:hypothetical protein
MFNAVANSQSEHSVRHNCSQSIMGQIPLARAVSVYTRCSGPHRPCVKWSTRAVSVYTRCSGPHRPCVKWSTRADVVCTRKLEQVDVIKERSVSVAGSL